jgi:hypothetical protein
MAASRSQVDPKGLARGAGTKRVLSALPLRGPQHQKSIVGLVLILGGRHTRTALAVTGRGRSGREAGRSQEADRHSLSIV